MADILKIRRANMDDAEKIYEVIRENPEEVLPRSFQDISMNFDRFYVYDDGEIKGVISWQTMPLIDPEENDRCIEVISFSVRKSEQKKGVGSALLNYMVGFIKELHPSRIIVLTFYPDYFKKFGFSETSKHKLYNKIYVGCINCTKHKSPLTCPEEAMELIL
jgi:amino-acid N-acetyltransferase